MAQYVFRRLLLMIPTILGGVLMIFVMFRVLPGDPVQMMMGGGGDAGTANPEAYNALRQELNLDKSIPVQFSMWLNDAAHGNLGKSYRSGHQVTEEIVQRLPTTFTLMILSLAITVVLSIPMGIVSALKQDTVIDYALRVAGLASLSMPSFWVGLLIIFTLISVWQWFPPISYTTPYRDPWLSAQQLFLPAIVLGLRPVGVAMRVLRSSLLEELRSDYSRTAHAKGLAARAVVWKHVLPNAFLPTLTVFGLEAAGLLGGAVIVESIFNVPGMGQLSIQSLQLRDFPVVQGMLLVVLGFVLMVNMWIDLMYGWIDPRIRL